MDDHQKHCQKVDLIVLGDEGGVDDGCGGEGHGSGAVVDRRCTGDLAQPVRPSGDPGSQRTPARRGKDGRSVV